MKRVLVWLWMIPVVVFFHVFIIGLGPRIARWADEDGLTNCLLDALHRYWTRGGYIVVTPSPHAPWLLRWWHTDAFEVFTHGGPTADTVRRWDWAVRRLRLMPLTFRTDLESQTTETLAGASPADDEYLEVGI